MVNNKKSKGKVKQVTQKHRSSRLLEIENKMTDKRIKMFRTALTRMTWNSWRRQK